MRLISAELRGFRAFAESARFDLDAEAVVVVGANGHGKTSLLDGVLWALSGAIPRIGGDAQLVSLYSDAGQIRVELHLRDRVGEELKVVRSFDGLEQRLSLEEQGRSLDGQAAEVRLADLVWPEANSSSDVHAALASVLTRSTYLQQDLVRQFVDATSDEDRFSAVSELLGAGRVTELQASLESSKREWKRGISRREDDVSALRKRLATSEDPVVALDSSEPSNPDEISIQWDEWVQAVVGFFEVRAVPWDAREASGFVDATVKKLNATKMSISRQVQNIRAIESSLADIADPPKADVGPLRDRVQTAVSMVDQLKKLISTEQGRVAEHRRVAALMQEQHEQTVAFASLALKLLGDRCPVCEQTYDQTRTKLRLEHLVLEDNKVPVPQTDLPRLVEELSEKERELAAAQSQLRQAEFELHQRETARREVEERIAELGVTVDDTDPVLEQITGVRLEAERKAGAIADLEKAGERLALAIARRSSIAAARERKEEAQRVRGELEKLEKDLESRRRTHQLSQSVVNALREASLGVVASRLRSLTPLLQSIYARIDPHPSLRSVEFMSRVFGGKGRLLPTVSDRVAGKSSEYPSAVLSSSQVNSLAVCIFLSLNLGLARPPLDVAMLDDPLQSLDDVNLLGLLDVLRRTKYRRQLIVSTHDVRFGDLLARKLRPLNEAERTLSIALSGWNRTGPSVNTAEIPGDRAPLRLAVS